MAIEERVSRLEGILEQMNERLGNLERGQEALRLDVQGGQEVLRLELNRDQEALRLELNRDQEALRLELNRGQEALRAETRSNFHWTVGLLLGMWGTVIATILGALLLR